MPNAFTGTSRWKGLKTIGVVVYKSLIKGEERIDIRYFISSLPLGIEQFSKAVRRHWGIETTCHWSLDVTYGEDGLRTRQRTIAENFRALDESITGLLAGESLNELYFHRWRPQNITYLFGFRKHEQGNNAADIAKFDPFIQDLEKQIHEL